MATIGEQLLQTESGWKRYDDTDSNITYIGIKQIVSGSKYSNDSLMYFQPSENCTIKFNFIGSKIRLIDTMSSNRSSNMNIKIDDINYTFSDYSPNSIDQRLMFEKAGLLFKEHFVEISNNQKETVYGLDAIDIDENGKLKPYNPNVSSKKYTDNIIPIMTSDENTNIKLSCSAYYITQTGSKKLFPYLAFDNTVNSAWNFENQSQPTGGHWLKIFFKDRTRCIAKITIRNGVHASESVKNFKLQGSNDDILYEDIYVGFHPYGDLDTSKAIYEFDNNESYKYYRILIIDSYYSQSTTYGEIGELEMMEEVLSNKYLIKQNNNYYSINNNYIDLGKIDNSEELNNIMDEYGYNDLSILTKELNNKRIPTKLENDYYKSFDINLNDIKDNIHLMEENDKKYIEYDCDNYKISDKVKEINNAKFEVLMKG
ncbi:cell adhesion protein [Clostridium botulinum]|uniref:cell adhesion protein n=1 Tax=Clostridium botulinum TaxID=1491 RepID=UPI001FD6B3FA|nr:cell adhesion protein [Clostridium botulinum]MCJ8172588.1 cell adhesion protein [Clostridium botulinum]